MPFFMDLHIVPGVKAKGVAEAHQLDVQLEEEYDCKCMTYWVDEARGNVFCLIDAPSKEAVIRMHTQAHGLVPHRIIEVQASVVESFLGRVNDPDEKAHTEQGLKIFHDSSFRILLRATIQDPALTRHRLGSAEAAEVFQQYQQALRQAIAANEGTEAECRGTGFWVSFTRASRAVNCALAVREALPDEETGLRISISAGEPVAGNENLFGDAISLANRMCFIAQNSRPLLTPAVKELIANDLFRYPNEAVLTLSQKEEGFLHQLFNALDEHWQEPAFTLDRYSRKLALSQSQLYRKTCQLTGLSPNTLLKDFRLEKAKERLQEKKYSVAEISFDNGFTSPSYFTKCFKAKYGLQPLAYVNLLS